MVSRRLTTVARDRAPSRRAFDYPLRPPGRDAPMPVVTSARLHLSQRRGET